MKIWMMLPLLATLLAPTTAAAADENPGEMANQAMELFKSPETRGEALALPAFRIPLRGYPPTSPPDPHALSQRCVTLRPTPLNCQ